MEETEFDHDKYREALLFLSKTAYDEYRYVCLDIPKYQATLLRTYLWLSSIVLTVETGFAFKLLSNEIKWQEIPLVPGECFYIFYGVALLLSLIAFALGVDTLRGRGISRFALGNFNNLAQEAYEMAFVPGSTTLYPTMISALDEAINCQVATIDQKGKKLRWTSRLILLSVLLALWATLGLFFLQP